MDGDGFLVYWQRNDGKVVEKNVIILNNRYEVPSNVELLAKYHSHINVE